MLKVGIMGIGNTGNQIATLAKEKINIPVMAINSSEKDLETVPDTIPRKLITLKDGDNQGAGKDRKLAKQYLKNSITKLVKDDDVQKLMQDLNVLFIVSSTGGGTGSGTAPILAKIMSQTFVDTKVILVGVLPVNSEALGSHVNTLEYLQEIYKQLPDQTYMLYDNDKYADLRQSFKILEAVNEDVVNDIDIIRCHYNLTTKYSSIDDKDMLRIIDFPGLLRIGKLYDIKEKDCDKATLEDMIIDNLKRNSHVESQRDKRVVASGIITNLSEVLNAEFDTNTPKVREFIGEPIHAFEHIYVNEDRKQPNNIFLVLSGLSPINDKIRKIEDRIEEIEEKQRIADEDNSLNDIDMDKLSDKVSDKHTDKGDEGVNIQDIFSSFGI